jgi:Malectin domain
LRTIAPNSPKLRLHFAEVYWTAVGQRRFNVFINGVQVLTNYDIIAAAGTANRANIQEFNVVPSGGQIAVQYVTVTDNAKASGLELLLPPPLAPGGLVANARDTQVVLSWNAVPHERVKPWMPQGRDGVENCEL